jgi:hypothetical protein
LLTWGGMPVGAALIGLLAEVCGTRNAFLLFAVAVAATVPPFLRNVTGAELGRNTGRGTPHPEPGEPDAALDKDT